MKSYLVTFLLILGAYSVTAQVNLLTLNELEQRITKGKDTTYVVNFWATWCGPCVEELPAFEKVNKENANQPLKVILMSLDFKSKINSEVVPFIKKNNIKSEVYVVNEPDQQKFIDRVDKDWSGALPATLILNTHKKSRAFYEKSFTYQELAKAIVESTK